MDWMARAEALDLLGVRPQTLYAYVSRGLLAARPDPRDPRASLYARDDLLALAGRARSRRTRAAVAQGAIAWGEPVMESTLTSVEGGRLFYAGVDAVELSTRATLEDAASLLWREVGPAGRSEAVAIPSGAATAKARGFAWLAAQAGAREPSPDEGPREGAALMAGLAAAMTRFEGQAPVHARFAAYWGLDAAGADLVRRALVLLADHELNPSTFAARVAASTGASLAACALAGFAALSGPRHGEAAAGALACLRACAEGQRDEALRAWLAAGAPGTGHTLYPSGDPRAAGLLGALDASGALGAGLAADMSAAVTAAGERPNIDLALAALTVALGLGDEAPFCLFATARMAGWIAHALEQRRSGAPIRPRARYVGPPARPEA